VADVTLALPGVVVRVTDLNEDHGGELNLKVPFSSAEPKQTSEVKLGSFNRQD